MSDRNLTLIEYHSHGNGPRILPDLLGTTSEEAVEESEATDDDESGRRLGPVIALVLLVAFAAGYRYYRSRGGEERSEGEQVAVTEYES